MRLVIIYLAILLAFPVFGQVTEHPQVQEDPLQVIRQLTSENQYEEAIRIARQELELQPQNSDISVMLARIYAWQGEYGKSSSILDTVLEEHPGHNDALMLQADLIYWQNDWEDLYRHSGKLDSAGISNETIQYYKALAAFEMGRREEAIGLLDQLTADNPANEKAVSLKREVLLNSTSPEFFVQYFHDRFNDPYSRRWHMITAGGIIPFSKGTFIPSINGGHLLNGGTTFANSSAVQLNTDAYLLLTERNYMLAGYGFSGGTFFPRHRAVLNLWQVLPGGWAVSAGARYFYWDQHFAFLTISGEKYLGNFWFNLNNSFFFKDYGVSLSSYLTMRRYLGNKFHYISATIGYGTSPDEPLVSITDLQRLNALTVRFGYMQQVHPLLRIGASVGYLREETLPGIDRNRIDGTLGLYFKLNSE